jgi:prepilin peptidase CpaA
MHTFSVEPMTLAQIASIVVVLAACVPDIRTRRIPNALTFGAALAAAIFHGATSGWSGLMVSVAGWMVGAALFFPFFALRGMGAGDVKLMAAVGAWLGPLTVFWAALFTSVAGGVIGLAVAAAHGYHRTAVMNVSALIGFWRVAGIRPLPELSLEGPAPRLAYAVPIAIGTVATLWLK